MSKPRKWTLKDVRKSLLACAPLFHALGDVNRQEILLLLAKGVRMNVGELAEHVECARPTVSHHLKVLKEAGLVDSERQSRENVYFLVWDDSIAQLKKLIDQAEVACS
ncbi:MAG: ArsR/SmtB family transcription factor [Limnobacter sp.]|uniref:ArsR/SmtB family transcription factor n=1 Tax=Limnobacter sp. TaxID=2003368 RepID=UPI00391907A5